MKPKESPASTQTPARTHGPGQPERGLWSEIERPGDKQHSRSDRRVLYKYLQARLGVVGWRWRWRGTLFVQLFDIMSQKLNARRAGTRPKKLWY